MTAQEDKPWVLATGFNRGIGNALFEELRGRYNFLTLGRNATSNAQGFLRWDLSVPPDASLVKNLSLMLQGRTWAGFVHCAGILGDMALLTPENRAADTSKAFWVNFFSAQALFDTMEPHLLAGSRERKAPAFFLHLSSGAARSPYQGWEAYCSSKAAMLMYARCLALKHKAETLAVLSVAPGTVMTPMMQQVLSADPKQFPALEKFQDLKKQGRLVEAQIPARSIAQMLEAPHQWAQWHGMLYDVRTSEVI